MAKSGELKMPYLYGEARSAYETPMEWENHYDAPETESQWKQPYKYESYPKMEWELAWPGQAPYPQPPGGTIYIDCEPKGDAVGGGATDPCYSGINCGQWAFTCAHRITKFEVPQSFGWIQSIKYGANDTVIVTVCWDEAARAAGAKLGIHAIGPNGFDYVSYVDMQNCCPDKSVCSKVCGYCAALVLSYSSQQMTCTGGSSTQALSASGGGGKYTWSLSGGGKLSKTKGPTTVYTAPTTNENCVSNPTITLRDCCGIQKTLKIAVTCVTGGTAYNVLSDTQGGGGCVHVIQQKTYGCAGETGATIGCDSCDCQTCSNCCCTAAPWECNLPCSGFSCTQAALIARCNSCSTCTLGIHDIRTAQQKTDGCCPVALLT
jgi:hypothetical protein